MHRSTFYIQRYDWHVTIYYGASTEDSNTLLRDLEQSGCAGAFLRTAKEQLESGNLNTGLTYSNFDRHLTIISIGRASSPMQLLNTLQHEQRHLETHIAKTFHLDPFGEEICYLAGHIAELTFPVCFHLTPLYPHSYPPTPSS